mgnify:CR=1 FL=1
MEHLQEKYLQQIESGLVNESVNVLCFMDDAQIQEEERFQDLVKHLFIESFPLRQAHFNRAFHSKKTVKLYYFVIRM